MARVSTILMATILGTLAGACAHGQQSDPRVTDPIEIPDAELVEMVRDASDCPFGDAGELLRALEAADEGLRTFSAQVRWDRTFRLQGDRHTRLGELFFEVKPDPEGGEDLRTFAVDFRNLIIDDVQRTDRSQWIFDGQWLIEKIERDKKYIARRLAKGEERIDPLRLGEGPIPLPIGQKADEMQARYETELLPAGDGLRIDPAEAFPEEIEEAAALLEFVAGTCQLRLVPREAFAESDQFTEIRLWYRPDTLQPRMALTVNRQGDESVVRLIGVRTNEEIPEEVLSTAPPPDDEGWDVIVDEGRFAPDVEGEQDG